MLSDIQSLRSDAPIVQRHRYPYGSMFKIPHNAFQTVAELGRYFRL